MSGPVPEPEDVEEVDAVPVLASDGAALAAQRSQGAVVVKQAAAVAVGSFAAGMATVAAVRMGKSVASRPSRARLPSWPRARSWSTCTCSATSARRKRRATSVASEHGGWRCEAPWAPKTAHRGGRGMKSGR